MSLRQVSTMFPHRWAERIAAAWQASLAGIFEAGRLLIAAKADLGHGEFEQMIETELPFKPSTAQRLMIIARDQRLSNPAHGQLFPPSWRTLYELTKLPDEEFEAKIADGSIHPEMQRKDVARETRRARQGRRRAVAELAAATDTGSARHQLYNFTFRRAMAQPPDVFDWIVTDPPYGREYLDLYSDLGRVAAYALKEGGSLLCMTGQSYLPDVLDRLCQRLSYHWTLAYLTPGGQAVQVFPRRVNTFWKPVLWLTKADHEGDWVGDVTRSSPNDNDKRFHDWGQSESGMADLMKRFVKPGDWVMDPFMGGGTTGVVAMALGAYFVGYDDDDDAFNEAVVRLDRARLVA